MQLLAVAQFPVVILDAQLSDGAGQDRQTDGIRNEPVRLVVFVGNAIILPVRFARTLQDFIEQTFGDLFVGGFACLLHPIPGVPVITRHIPAQTHHHIR